MARQPNTRRTYAAYTRHKAIVTLLLGVACVCLAILAVQAGSAGLTTTEVLRTLLGMETGVNNAIVWNIRLPRVLGAIIAGAGLSIAGAVSQSVLRNPLASPYTLGISQGAAFGAAVAIIGFGAGSMGSQAIDAVRVLDVGPVTACAFLGAMIATLAIIGIARHRGTSPETMVLAGVALGSLFSAGTVLLQYFAEDTQVAAIVFWTFGDLGRASWRDLGVMGVAVLIGLVYFLWHRWDYNALEGGVESAQGLGVNVARIRMIGMLVASLVTAAVVSFLGIIGFIGLVGPHLVRRVLGDDHRYLLPASAFAGALLLLAADTVARTVISPVVLPVGAITSFLGAPLFLYLLVSRKRSL